MKRKINIFKVDIDCLTIGETVNEIKTAIINGNQIVQNSINANKVVLMDQDKELFRSLESADLVNADGQSIVWASKILNRPLPERVPGIDLMDEISKMANKEGFGIYLLGAENSIVRSVVDIYSIRFSGNIVRGFRNGFFEEKDEMALSEEINNSGSDILFVGIPSPGKENFINRNRQRMPNVSFIMGVGGSFDVIAGKVRRAPKWTHKIGLEWMYRLVQEPGKMWKRYLIGNIKFIRLLMIEKRLLNV